MVKSMTDIVKKYKFPDRIAMLTRSKNMGHTVFNLHGFNPFLRVRELVKSGHLKVSSAKWLNGNTDLSWVGDPKILEESAYDDEVSVKYDLRDYSITVEMRERGYVLNNYNDRCVWKIKANMALFKTLIEDRINIAVCELMENIYEQELRDEQLQAMQRIASQLHRESKMGVVIQGSPSNGN